MGLGVGALLTDMNQLSDLQVHMLMYSACNYRACGQELAQYPSPCILLYAVCQRYSATQHSLVTAHMGPTSQGKVYLGMYLEGGKGITEVHVRNVVRHVVVASGRQQVRRAAGGRAGQGRRVALWGPETMRETRR